MNNGWFNLARVNTVHTVFNDIHRNGVSLLLTWLDLEIVEVEQILQAHYRWLLPVVIVISIYKLGDVGILSNLIGSLSLTNEQCPPPGRWIMKQWPA